MGRFDGHEEKMSDIQDAIGNLPDVIAQTSCEQSMQKQINNFEAYKLNYDLIEMETNKVYKKDNIDKWKGVCVNGEHGRENLVKIIININGIKCFVELILSLLSNRRSFSYNSIVIGATL